MIRFVQTSQTFNVNILNENLNLDINLSLNVVLVSKVAFWIRFKQTFWLQIWTLILIWVVITVRVLTIRSTVFCVSKKAPWHQAHPLFFRKWTWNIVFSICGHDVVCSVSRNRLTRSWIELLVFSVQMMLCLHFFRHRLVMCFCWF